MSFQPLPRARRRWIGALAAVLASGGLMTAVLAVFFTASSQPWLLPTADVLEAAADCRALHGRAEQDACLSRLVATRGRALPADRRLAAASAPTSRR